MVLSLRVGSRFGDAANQQQIEQSHFVLTQDFTLDTEAERKMVKQWLNYWQNNFKLKVTEKQDFFT